MQVMQWPERYQQIKPSLSGINLHTVVDKYPVSLLKSLRTKPGHDRHTMFCLLQCSCRGNSYNEQLPASQRMAPVVKENETRRQVGGSACAYMCCRWFAGSGGGERTMAWTTEWQMKCSAVAWDEKEYLRMGGAQGKRWLILYCKHEGEKKQALV